MFSPHIHICYNLHITLHLHILSCKLSYTIMDENMADTLTSSHVDLLKQTIYELRNKKPTVIEPEEFDKRPIEILFERISEVFNLNLY